MGITEAIHKLEDIRQKMIIIIGVIGIGFVFCLSTILMHPERGMSMMMPILLMGLVFAGAICSGILNKKFKKLYKDTFVMSVLNENFEHAEYCYERGFNTDTVRKMGLTKLGNRFHTEDYIHGYYSGIEFEQADVTIKYETSGKNRHTTTYFKGRMFQFAYPEKRAVSIQVFSNNFMYRGKTYEGWKGQKIQLEEADFNKKYDVISMDAHEAFYVLTPPVMERIKKTREQYGNIAMHFTHGKLYVAFNSNRDAFDASIFHKIDYMTEKQRINQDVLVIKQIIEEMILN